MTEFRLLLESEVAKVLRCSPRSVGRLRLVGLIRFLPGRPPRIDEADLRAYIDATKRPAKLASDPAMNAARLPEEELARVKLQILKKWEDAHDEIPDQPTARLLTESEVAEALGRTKGDVERLRLEKYIAYLPGKPPLIEDVDLFAYLAPTKDQIEAGAERRHEEELQRVYRRVRLKWLRRQIRSSHTT